MNPDERRPRPGNTPLTDEQLMASLLKQHQQHDGPPTFKAGFADRVMAEIASAHHRSAAAAPRSAPSFSIMLEHMFLRIAPLAAAALLILAVMNVASSRDEDAPWIDRALGLPTVTLASAYSSTLDILNESETLQ